MNNKIQVGDIVICAIKKMDGTYIMDKIPYIVKAEKKQVSDWAKSSYPSGYGYPCTPLCAIGQHNERERTILHDESRLFKVSKAKEYADLQNELENKSEELYGYLRHNFIRPNQAAELAASYDFKAKTNQLKKLYKGVEEEFKVLLDKKLRS